MKSLTIPTILAATVLVAAVFAFIPIEQASTVHNTILDDSLEVREVTGVDVEWDETKSIQIVGAQTTDQFQVSALIIAPGVGGTPAGNGEDISLIGATVDGADANILNTLGFSALGANGQEVFTSIFFQGSVTGNDIRIGMAGGFGGDPVDDGDTVTVTAKILIKSGATNPTVRTV